MASAPAVHRGTRLLEVDFSGVEAVLSGWSMGDPHFIRLAKLGVHAGLASHVLKRPYEGTWADAEIARYFKAIKHDEPQVYDRSKRCVHGKNYGLTVHGMTKNFPETFPNLKIARQFEVIYEQMAPALPVWHTDIRQVAYDLNYLGGARKPQHYSDRVAQVFARNPRLAYHPYGYKHWFWSVLGFRPISFSLYSDRLRRHEPVTQIQGKYFAVTLGDDAKRAVAFFPQSIAAALLKEVMLRLFTPGGAAYIGDAYYGRTPLRAPIHDSLLLEVPWRVWDYVLEQVYREMMRPVPELPLDWVDPGLRQQLGLGPLLSIGVAAKAGMDWLNMEDLASPTLQELGVAPDGRLFSPADEDLESLEEAEALGTVA